MPPLRFALGRTFSTPHSDRGAAPVAAVDLVAVSMARADHREAVVTLATQCRSEDPAGHFNPHGLLAELTGRPARLVHAWLAWPAATATIAATGSDADTGPLGLVALVTAGVMPKPRFSIAWLLVHPAARRRGIATALVNHAVAHAESFGATEISAETLPSWPAAVGFWRSFSRQQEG